MRHKNSFDLRRMVRQRNRITRLRAEILQIQVKLKAENAQLEADNAALCREIASLKVNLELRLREALAQLDHAIEDK